MSKKEHFVKFVVVAFMLTAPLAFAQPYPSRQIKVIVPSSQTKHWVETLKVVEDRHSALWATRVHQEPGERR